MPTTHAIHTIHTKHTILSKHAIPDRPYTPYIPTIPYHTPTTPQGGRGTVPHPHHTTGGGGGRSHMGPVYGTHPIWGGRGGGRAWCIYIYIHTYIYMCVIRYNLHKFTNFGHNYWMLSDIYVTGYTGFYPILIGYHGWPHTGMHSK